MKKIFLGFFIFLILSAFNSKAQYNSVGYDATSGQWNVVFNDIHWGWSDNEPSRVKFIVLNFQNNTANSISMFDVELTLISKGKIFFKKLCQISIPGGCDTGEISDTEEWYFATPITKTNFENKFSWSAKVVACYSPKTN